MESVRGYLSTELLALLPCSSLANHCVVFPLAVRYLPLLHFFRAVCRWSGCLFTGNGTLRPNNPNPTTKCLLTRPSVSRRIHCTPIMMIRAPAHVSAGNYSYTWVLRVVWKWAKCFLKQVTALSVQSETPFFPQTLMGVWK